MLDISDGLSLVWVLMERHSKFSFISDFEFWIGSKWILVVDILTQILLTLLTFVAVPVLRKKYKNVVDGRIFKVGTQMRNMHIFFKNHI